MIIEKVDHPSHYGGKDNPYEHIKVMAAWLSPEGFAGYCIGQATKYLVRYKDKGGLEDLKKSSWYMRYFIKYEQDRLTVPAPVEVHLNPDITSTLPLQPPVPPWSHPWSQMTQDDDESKSPPGGEPGHRYK